MRWRKLLKRIGYTILILFVLLNVMAAFHAYKFTHFYEAETKVETFKPEKAGFWGKAGALLFGVKSYRQRTDSIPFLFEKVILTTSDSLKLEAWQSMDISDSRGTIGTVIMFHGHGGNKAGVLKEAWEFIRLNYAVLMVDFRAHGNSEGETCTIGYNEARDVKAAYDYVSARGDTNIVFYGISLGAAAEMKAVKDYNLRPAKMILEMPFGSLQEAVKGRCKILGVPTQPTAALLTFWGGVENGFWAFDHNPEDYATSINCPVLLQWGEKDIRVIRKETETIFKNIASAKKQLIIYSKSGHQSLCANENELWRKSVSNFLIH